MSILTKDQFDAACKIQKKLAELEDRKEAAIKQVAAVRNEIAKTQAQCEHPFVKRSTAESDVICEICGGEA